VDSADLAVAPDLLDRLARSQFPSRDYGDETATSAIIHELETHELFRARICDGDVDANALELVLWSYTLFRLLLRHDPKGGAILATVWRPRLPADQPAAIDGSPRSEIAFNLDPDLYSPWLTQKRFQNQAEVDQLRCLGGLDLDIEILERLGVDLDPVPFILHTLSTIDDLRRYRFHEHRPADPGKDPRIGDIGWLAQTLGRSAVRALSDGAVSPSLIVDFARAACDGEGTIAEFLADYPARRDARQITMGLLTTGCLRLVENALEASVRTERSPWLGESAAVVALQSRHPGGARGQEYRVLGKLIARFLSNEGVVNDIEDTQILELLISGERPKKGAHRRLLLAPTKPSHPWARLDDQTVTDESSFDIDLAIAMQRVSAAHADPDLNVDVAARWREQLARLLRRIDTPVKFDRFSRLKLIEMIELGELDDHAEQLLVPAIAVLVVFSGTFHMRELVHAVTCYARRAPEAVDARLAIQQILTHYIEESEVLHSRRRASSKALLICQMQACCLYAAPGSPTTRALRERARRDRDLPRSNPPVSQPVSFETDDQNRLQLSVLGRSSPWVALPTANMLALDLGSGAGRMVQWAPGDPRVINGFTSGGAPTKESILLGVVERFLPRPDAGRQLILRTSSTGRDEWPDLTASPPDVGDLVALGRIHAEFARIPAPPVARVATIEALVDQGGPHFLATVGRRQLRLSCKETWNHSALFSEALGTYQVAWRNDGPRDLDLADLLVDFSKEVAEHRPVTLSIHALTIDDNDRLASLVLEARPLQRYRIDAELALSEACREAITATVKSLRGAVRGLLISVDIADGPLGPQLELAAGMAEIGGLPYPELERPFDKRNLTWRDLFAPMTGQPVLWATIDTGRRLKAETPVKLPGFPNWLEVRPLEPQRISTFVQIHCESWDPYSASIEGRAIKSWRLDGESPEERIASVRKLLKQRPGMLIKVPRYLKFVRREGLVQGFSGENISVLVRAESLSMRVPWPQEAAETSRSVLISRVVWRRRTQFVLRIDPDDVPEEARFGGKAQGHLTYVSVDPAASELKWRIVWVDRAGECICEGEIQITNLAEVSGHLQAPQGARVIVSFERGEATGELQEVALEGDAIWTRAQDIDAEPPARSAYIGAFALDDDVFEAWEVGTGQFAFKRCAAQVVNARAQAKLALGLEDDYVVAVDGCQRATYTRPVGGERRCALALDGGVVAGVTTLPVQHGRPVRLTGLQFEIEEAPETGRYLLRRRFQLLPEDGEIFASVSQDQEAEEQADDGLEDEVVKAPDTEVLEGSYNTTAGILEFRGTNRTLYPGGLIIDPQRVTQAPLAGTERYASDNAIAVLMESVPAKGSFTDTPQTDPARLFAVLPLFDMETRRSYQLNPAKLRMHFVGRRKAPDDSWDYLFEWGFGVWTALPAGQVLYNGESADLARHMVFGDRIAAARVQTGDHERPVLNILAVAASRAHQIFRASRDHQVVSLLNIAIGQDKEPVIESIEGFDPTNALAPNTTMFAPHARLDERSKLLVQQRAKPGVPQRIFARLNLQAFEATNGENFIFSHVRMDGDGSSSGLKAGERFFVRAGAVNPIPNDIAIFVTHPNLHPDDVGAAYSTDDPKAQVLRRAFSIRQQTLFDIYDSGLAGELIGSTFMVRRVGVGHSLIDGSLPRNPAVIDRMLMGGVDVLAAYQAPDEGEDQATLQFELQPGVIVRLDSNEIEFSDNAREQGDLFRISKGEGGRLLARLAAPSDGRFVVEGRPAVVLPRQSLSIKNGRQGTGYFSVGDLPGLDARLKRDTGSLSAVMSKPHPKLAELSRGVAGGAIVEFSPGLAGAISAGALSIDHPRRRPPSVKIVRQDGEAGDLPTDWHLLSFRDGGASDIARAAENAWWRFHDTLTFRLIADEEGVLTSRKSRVPQVRATTGPLFFDVLPNGRASLRHGLLRKFAVGLSGLIGPLAYATRMNRRLDAVVAGALAESLFIELSPGRIVELPAAGARYIGFGRAVPLDALDWRAFAPGDRLFISAAIQADPLAPPDLILDWTHGGRNSFSPRGALLCLDVGATNSTNGTAFYGAGAVRIRIPSQEPESLPELAVINHTGILPAPAAGPERFKKLVACTVLLVADGENGIAVHGLPGVTVRPENYEDWSADPLMRGVVSRSGNGPLSFVAQHLRQLIDLAGGAFPMTIRGAVPNAQREGGLLYLGRDFQFAPLAPGRTIRATVCGTVPNTGLVQMAVGSRYFAISADALVQGAVGADQVHAVAALAQAGVTVWLRADTTGLGSGYVRPTGVRGAAVPIAVAGHDGVFRGVVCESLQDGALRWMPASEAAACSLSLSEAHAIFGFADAAIHVEVFDERGSVSILRHPRVCAELNRLTIGAPMGAVPFETLAAESHDWGNEHSRTDWQAFLVRSSETGLVLAAVGPTGARRRKRFDAEVAARRQWEGSPQIMLAPAHGRRPVADGPAWLFDGSELPWSDSAVRYLSLHKDFAEVAELVAALDEARPAEISPARLEALTRLYINSGVASLAVGIALSIGLSAAADKPGPHGFATKTALVDQLIELNRRAMRSVPLEIIARWRASLPAGPMTERGEIVLTAFRSQTRDEARTAVSIWLERIAALKASPDETALANAFAALLGLKAEFGVLLGEAQILSQVVAATRPAGVTDSPTGIVLKACIERLTRIGRDVLDSGDLPLQPRFDSE
jgi:hypothetical protein